MKPVPNAAATSPPAREEEQGVNKVPANLLALPAVPWALSMRYPAIVQQDAGGLVVSVTVPSASHGARSNWAAGSMNVATVASVRHDLSLESWAKGEP